MLKLLLGTGTIMLMFLTMIVSYIAMSIWISAAKYCFLKG
jgi:hypothetical protein